MYLYIHIPFCKQKCSYCDFNSGNYNEDIHNKYIDAIILELNHIKSINNIQNLKTIYIGGGTPSSLSKSNLIKLLSFIKKYFVNSNLKEYTIECNPESVTDEFVSIIKNYSINRVSMGVQSTDNETLIFLNRLHDFQDVIKAMMLFNKYDIKNINLDLIYTIPNQKHEILEKSLNDIVSLKPSHISCYSLIFEKNTPLYSLLKKGMIEEVSDENFVLQYRFIIEYLKSFGYLQYEISNFAKENFHSIHNTAYWNNRNYIGIGASAYSKYDNIRYSNIYNVKSYINCYLDKKTNETSNNIILNSPFTPSTDIKNIDYLNEKDIFNEYIILGLRQNKGISLDVLDNYFKNKNLKSHKELFYKNLNNFIKKMLIYRDDKIIFLSQCGRELSNSIYVDLMI